jgi:hypothetical protein
VIDVILGVACATVFALYWDELSYDFKFDRCKQIHGSAGEPSTAQINYCLDSLDALFGSLLLPLSFVLLCRLGYLLVSRNRDNHSNDSKGPHRHRGTKAVGAAGAAGAAAVPSETTCTNTGRDESIAPVPAARAVPIAAREEELPESSRNFVTAPPPSSPPPPPPRPPAPALDHVIAPPAPAPSRHHTTAPDNVVDTFNQGNIGNIRNLTICKNNTTTSRGAHARPTLTRDALDSVYAMRRGQDEGFDTDNDDE